MSRPFLHGNSIIKSLTIWRWDHLWFPDAWAYCCWHHIQIVRWIRRCRGLLRIWWLQYNMSVLFLFKMMMKSISTSFSKVLKLLNYSRKHQTQFMKKKLAALNHSKKLKTQIMCNKLNATSVWKHSRLFNMLNQKKHKVWRFYFGWTRFNIVLCH